MCVCPIWRPRLLLLVRGVCHRVVLWGGLVWRWGRPNWRRTPRHSPHQRHHPVPLGDLQTRPVRGSPSIYVDAPQQREKDDCSRDTSNRLEEHLGKGRAFCGCVVGVGVAHARWCRWPWVDSLPWQRQTGRRGISGRVVGCIEGNVVRETRVLCRVRRRARRVARCEG